MGPFIWVPLIHIGPPILTWIFEREEFKFPVSYGFQKGAHTKPDTATFKMVSEIMDDHEMGVVLNWIRVYAYQITYKVDILEMYS